MQRGQLRTFPPGDYVLITGSKPVHVANERTMWEYIFTLKPADGQGPEQISRLYNAADHFQDVDIWNECGRGSCDQGQSADFTVPLMRSLSNPNAIFTPKLIKFF